MLNFAKCSKSAKKQNCAKNGIFVLNRGDIFAPVQKLLRRVQILFKFSQMKVYMLYSSRKLE